MFHAILLQLVEGQRWATEIVESGFDDGTVKHVARLVKIAEFKRRQMPLGSS